MSDPILRCACGEPLRAGDNYCAGCGLEVDQICPACREERRWLRTIVAGVSPWCERRGALLAACERCGRWLLPGLRRCPDPDCEARVLPSAPQHTGRRWDGRGGTAAWRWPARWETRHPEYALPQMDRWTSADPVHAAFAAHGRLYVWAGTNLLALTAGAEAASGFAGGQGGSGALWRVALGANVRPAPHLPFAERAAVAGAGVTLATERVLMLTGLYSRGDNERMEGGAPLAQVGGPNWWAAWTAEGGVPALRYAAIGQNWDSLAPSLAETPASAALAAGGRMALRDDRVYWPAQDGGVWQLDGATGAVMQVIAAQDGLQNLWAEPDGPRTVRETQGRLLAGLSAPRGGKMPQETPAGTGPLRAALATGTSAVVVGERMLAFDARTGERLYEANRPPGRWIAGALAEGDDNDLWLLALTIDGGMGRLSATKVSGGNEELLWMEPDIEPLALIPAGSNLFIAHSRGLIRLFALLSG